MADLRHWYILLRFNELIRDFYETCSLIRHKTKQYIFILIIVIFSRIITVTICYLYVITILIWLNRKALKV